jgi:hypothetical protein
LILHKNSKPATKVEKARIERMMALGCICCYQFGGWIYPECHHIVSGNRRMGHWYTLPICSGHHRGAWTGLEYGPRIALSDGGKLFVATFGSERELWKKVQDRLALPYLWPVSKILPRRVA